MMDPTKNKVTLTHSLANVRVIGKRTGKWGVNGPARIYVVRGTSLETGEAELYALPEGVAVFIDSDIPFND